MQDNTNQSSFQNELNKIVSSEPSRFKVARSNAKFDFESIKKQIKFVVDYGAYITNPDGSHTVTVMYPQYPNTTLRCYANEYLVMKTEEQRTRTGFFSKSYSTIQSLYCKVIDSDGFAVYKEELTKLCNEENISYKIVATPTGKRSSTLGLSSIYITVPGCIEANKNIIVNSYHIRLYATLTF